jgi:NADH-quinone oxidoreductase subunit J
LDYFSFIGEARMTLPFIMFFVFALIAIGGALLLIMAREPIHSALSLIVVMMSLAGLYLMLGAEFVAAVQIIVYAGAIMVLFVFVIMLLNAGVEERTDFIKMAKYAGIPLGILLLLDLAHWMAHSLIGRTPANGAGSANVMVSTRDLSVQLFQKYLFPFEATSILILIAILGALVLAKRDE